MKNKKKIKTLKARIKKLQSIITPNSLTLANKSDPNEKMVFLFDKDFQQNHEITSTKVNNLNTSN